MTKEEDNTRHEGKSLYIMGSTNRPLYNEFRLAWSTVLRKSIDCFLQRDVTADDFPWRKNGKLTYLFLQY